MKAAGQLKISAQFFGTDTNQLSPAFQLCDKKLLVKPIDDPAYIPELLKIVKKNRIRLLIPTIDSDLAILAENKAKMEAIESQKVDTLRLVEVNTYYSEYYATYKNLMLTIIFICVPIIILASLTRSGVIPQGLFGLLVAIIMIIGIVVLGRQIIDLSNRSNMVWDEYDWEFNTSEAPAATTTSSDDSSTDGTTTQMCTGEACCYENTTYDASSNMCIPTAMYDQDQEDAASTTSDDASTTSTSSTTSTATAATTTSAATATTTTATETFISNILGKYAWNSNDRNTTYLKHNTPKSSMPNTGLGGSPYNSNTV